MSRRPGGLTALAVMNFVFGGLGLLMNLFQIVAIEQLYSMAADKQAEAMGGQALPSKAAMYLGVALGIASGALLVTAGIGYIQQKRFLGRNIGVTYAIVAMISTVIEILLISGDFGMFTLFFWVYPLITLFLILVTFREDFVR